MSRSLFELMDDMHLSAQSTFLDYYNAMSANNVELAQQILDNNPELADQITNSENINRLINGINKNEEQPSKDIDDKLNELEEDFQKLIDDTEEIGAFNSATQYYSHNFVTYQGKHYFAKSTPPIGTLPTNTNYWQVYYIKGFQGFGGLSNVNYRGNWDSTIQYNIYDCVIYLNKMWWAIDNNKGYTPNLNHYPWQPIAFPMPSTRTPIQKDAPLYGYSTGDFWFEVTEGEDVSSSSWELMSSQIYSTTASSSFIIDNIIYIVGGQLADLSATNLTQAYDTTTNTWSIKANYPEICDGAMSFSLNGLGYRVGGINSMIGTVQYFNSVYSYNPTTNVWTKKNNFPVATANVNGGVVCNNTAYVNCGLSNNPLKTIYKYNTSNDTWSLETEIPTLVVSPAIQAIGNNIYVIGGDDNDNNILKTTYVYNTTTRTWSNGKDMPEGKGYAASFVNSQYIYVFGGLDSLLYSSDSVLRYNTSANTWDNQSLLQFARNSLNGEAISNYGYAIGGINLMQPMVGGYVERFQFDTAR